MANLEDLPDEMIVKILNYLNYDELLTIRKMNIRLSDLVDYVIGLNEVWLNFHTIDQLIPIIIKSKIDCKLIYSDRCLISNSTFNFLNNQDAYQKIKKLILFDLNFLPEKINFSNLIQLEIRQLGIVNNSKLIINAQNLEKLLINVGPIKDNFKITLETIKLKYFYSPFRKLNKFNFIYPNSLENLYCYDSTSLDEFKNLKELFCGEFKYSDLNIFKNLIHLNKFYFYCFDNPIELNRLFSSLNSINNNLAIYYCDVQLNSIDNFEDLNNIKQLNQFTKLELEIYKNYIHFLNSSNFFLELNMPNLNDLPLEIINKLESIVKLQINNNLQDDHKLIEILKTCKPLIMIINVQLEQRILNIINQFSSLNIRRLKIINLNDYNFIGNMKYLQELECDNFLEYNLFKFMIKNLKYLESIKMKTNFEIKLSYDQIQFLKKDQIKFRELKNIFINHTIDSINCWSDFFVDLNP